jgi:hypothetical protein
MGDNFGKTVIFPNKLCVSADAHMYSPLLLSMDGLINSIFIFPHFHHILNHAAGAAQTGA